MDKELEKFGPDRVFCWDDYHFPDMNVRSETTAREIYEKYYPWWKENVKKARLDFKDISFQLCVEDFCVVNYAWEKKASL